MPVLVHDGLAARPAPAPDLAAVRAWARSRGYPIDERGSVPLTVLRTYQRVRAAA